MKKIKKHIPAYLFILPNLIFICVFLIYPLIESIRISFYNRDVGGSEFIGLENYKTIFSDEVFMNSVTNTFYFVIIIVPIIIVVSFILAGLISGLKPLSKTIFRIIFYLPVVTSPIVLSMIWAWMYNPNTGILNYLLGLFGVNPIEWFSSQSIALISISVVVITWSIGQPLILYLASIDGIPKELYEAADIDGAGPIRKFFSITIPMVKNTSLFIIITTTIAVFQIFVVIYLLTGGGPYRSSETIVFTIYRTAFESIKFGEASAQSVVLFLIILIIVWIQHKIFRSED